jgi:hypothetical protein
LLKQLQNNQLNSKLNRTNSLNGSNTILGLPEHSPSVTSTNSSASNNSNNSSIKTNRNNKNKNIFFSPTSTIDTSAASRRNTSDKQSTLFVIAKNTPSSPQSTLPLNNTQSNNQNKLEDYEVNNNFSGNLEQDLVIEPLSKFGVLIQLKLLEEKVLLTFK